MKKPVSKRGTSRKPSSPKAVPKPRLPTMLGMLGATVGNLLHAVEGMNKTLQTQTAAIQTQNLRLSALDDAIAQMAVREYAPLYPTHDGQAQAEQRISQQMKEG